MTRRLALLPLSLLAASALSLGTLKAQIHATGDPYYSFLEWNLFLAWVPLAAATGAFVLARRGVGARVVTLLVVWLLFFPNAPYVLTDFIHLHGDGPAPIWYDALMLSSFAWTALMLGFASLYLVHRIVRRGAGTIAGWLVVVGALALGSFGVYLGRFARFNSWDVVLRPRRVLHVIRDEIANPLHNPRMVVALLVLTAFLLVGYLVVYTFAALRVELDGERERTQEPTSGSPASVAGLPFR